MRKSGILVIMPLLLVLFVMAGCSRSEKTETPAAKTVQQPAKQVVHKPGQYLRSCMKGRPETDRKYCECFAAQMQRHLRPGATAEDRGRASGLAALSCRKLK
ncbi:MAG: hypothetical protein ABIA59_08705 [Candidatus Latescibacterota bacterium]